MEGHLLMSAKERKRKSVFDMVKSGGITLKAASGLLGLSGRHCRRIYHRYLEEGDIGLVHRSRGRPGNRCKPPSFRKKVIAAYKKYYSKVELGPTLAAEKLVEKGLGIDHETLRRWLLAEGLWSRHRKHGVHRSRRERKAHFGELVQMDGSHHRWFGQEHDECCLMNMVDDATGTTMSLLAEEETTKAAMQVLWRWIERYGIPIALYTDRKSVFFTDREPTIEEQLADVTPMTTFGKACHKLGIEIITANSPQAKGRVERNHGVYQNRFVKELALRRIKTIKTANKLLQNGFVEQLNGKFAHEPASPQDLHMTVPKKVDLAHIFCFEDSRQVQNDWTIRYDNYQYQILSDNKIRPRSKEKITVRILLDDSMHFVYKNEFLKVEKIGPYRASNYAKTIDFEKERQKKDKTPPRPRTPEKTPWRQNVTYMFADTEKD